MTRLGGIRKKSEAGWALRSIQLNIRWRQRIMPLPVWATIVWRERKNEHSATASSSPCRRDSTSKIDVSGKGYLGAMQGVNTNTTSGRTNNNAVGSSDYNGGSYGGLGGSYSGALNGVYGDLANPNEQGSGGGGTNL